MYQNQTQQQQQPLPLTRPLSAKDISSDNNDKGWIQTFSNKKFYPLNPQVKDIDIESIAHGLANKCRFNGQVKKYYCVAQHSVLVSIFAGRGFELWGLLHDASEAYLVDMPKPLKVLPEFAWFREVENKVQDKCYEAFGLTGKEPSEVKNADIRCLVTEKRDLMGPTEHADIAGYDPFSVTIIPMMPDEAEAYFLERYRFLLENQGKVRQNGFTNLEKPTTEFVKLGNALKEVYNELLKKQ